MKGILIKKILCCKMLNVTKVERKYVHFDKTALEEALNECNIKNLRGFVLP